MRTARNPRLSYGLTLSPESALDYRLTLNLAANDAKCEDAVSHFLLLVRRRPDTEKKRTFFGSVLIIHSKVAPDKCASAKKREWDF